MSARVSAAERAALPVARAALESQGSAYGVVDTIVFALGEAQLLQSPETAAELEQAKTDARRYRIAWRMARTRAIATGGAADRAGARVRELLPAVQEAAFGLLGMQMERDTAVARVSELELERHSTNEALDDAVKAIRAKDARIAELEQQLTTAVESPLAWTEQLDAKSLDNFLISLGQATDYEPMNGAISYIHELLASFRVAAAARAGERS